MLTPDAQMLLDVITESHSAVDIWHALNWPEARVRDALCILQEFELVGKDAVNVSRDT